MFATTLPTHLEVTLRINNGSSPLTSFGVSISNSITNIFSA